MKKLKCRVLTNGTNLEFETTAEEITENGVSYFKIKKPQGMQCGSQLPDEIIINLPGLVLPLIAEPAVNLRRGRNNFSVPVSFISYFQSESRLATVYYTNGKKAVIDDSIEVLVKSILPQKLFFKIRSNTIVSRADIKEIDFAAAKWLTLTNAPGTRFSIAVRERVAFLLWYYNV